MLNVYVKETTTSYFYTEMEQDKYFDKYLEIYPKYKYNTSKFYSGMIDYRQGLINDLKELVKYGELLKVEVEKWSQPPNHPVICRVGLQFSYPVSIAYVYMLTQVKHRAGILRQGRYEYGGKEMLLSLYAYPENDKHIPSDH